MPRLRLHMKRFAVMLLLLLLEEIIAVFSDKTPTYSAAIYSRRSTRKVLGSCRHQFLIHGLVLDGSTFFVTFWNKREKCWISLFGVTNRFQLRNANKKLSQFRSVSHARVIQVVGSQTGIVSSANSAEESHQPLTGASHGSCSDDTWVNKDTTGYEIQLNRFEVATWRHVDVLPVDETQTRPLMLLTTKKNRGEIAMKVFIVNFN